MDSFLLNLRNILSGKKHILFNATCSQQIAYHCMFIAQ